MIRGYITRGTTVHGKPVNAGETHDLAPDTFRRLQLFGDVVLADEAPKQVEPAKVEAKTKTKKD